MKTLITGAFGFCGSHLVQACVEAGESVVAISRDGAETSGEVEVVAIDLCDPDATDAAIKRVQPTVVYHLAALASVGKSWQAPRAAVIANITLTLNLLEAVRKHAPTAKVLVAGSGEIYGKPVELPLVESSAINPQNPYALAKANIDQLGEFYANAFGMNIIRTRSFNHSGPGQSRTYAIASFAYQVAKGNLDGDRPVKVVSGNPKVRRDFTDVRDVVRAYRMLAQRVESGAFNVCSGHAVSISELVTQLGQAVGLPVEHVVDESLLRPNDTEEIRGSNELIKATIGWQPEIPLQNTLADAVAAWVEELRPARA